MPDKVLQNPAQLGDILVKVVIDRRLCAPAVAKRLLHTLVQPSPVQQLLLPQVNRPHPFAWARV